MAHRKSDLADPQGPLTHIDSLLSVMTLKLLSVLAMLPPSLNPILLCQVFWAIGTVFEVVLAVFVMPSLGWRWLLILSAVPLLLFAVLCFVGIL